MQLQGFNGSTLNTDLYNDYSRCPFLLWFPPFDDGGVKPCRSESPWVIANYYTVKVDSLGRKFWTSSYKQQQNVWNYVVHPSSASFNIHDTVTTHFFPCRHHDSSSGSTVFHTTSAASRALRSHMNLPQCQARVMDGNKCLTQILIQYVLYWTLNTLNTFVSNMPYNHYYLKLYIIL